MKRTVYMGSPVYLSVQHGQMRVELEKRQGKAASSIPLEDLSLLVLDCPQITVTHALIQAMQEENIALLSCASNHMPMGLMLPLYGHTRHREVLGAQLESSKPLRKQLWAQTVAAKVKNQAEVMKQFNKPYVPLLKWSREVASGDPKNLESRAAVHYWAHFMDREADFYREPEGPCPNDWLNYGYAIIRAIVARALVGSGLLPAWGLFHRNKYNPYCLADDIMEPYRVWVDAKVLQMMQEGVALQPLNREIKAEFIGLLYADAKTALGIRPLQLAIEETTASLARCFLGQERQLHYPLWKKPE